MDSSRTRSSLRREWLVCAVAAIVFSAPFLIRLNSWGIHDWELFTAMAEIPRALILTFKQFPFWNPYISGGNILFHHPEVGVISPFTPLTLITGAVIGLKVQVLVCYFLGFWGTVRLARKLDQSEWAAYLVAAAYFGGSFFALHFAEGHIPFTHFCFLPWALYFWLKSFDRRVFVLAGAAAIALMILGNGAAVPFLYFASVSFTLALCLSLRRSQFTPLINFVTLLTMGVAVAAIKFVPMLVYLLQNPWSGTVTDFTPLHALPDIFFGLNQTLLGHEPSGIDGPWHEFGAYISPVVVALALWRCAQNWKASWPWFFVAILFFMIGMGDYGTFSPWTLLHNLPGWSSSRASGRAFQFTILGLAILAGYGLDDFRERLRRYKKLSAYGGVFIGAIVASVALTNIVLSRQSLSQSFTREPESVIWDEDFQQRVGDDSYLYKSVRENRGSLIAPWLSGYPSARGLVTPDRRVLPEFVSQGSAAILRREYRGNEINYNVTSTTGGEIVFGMGYDPGWKVFSPKNAPLRNEQGLLAVGFDTGESHIELRYVTPYFGAGCVVSCAALLLALFLWRRWSVE